MSRSHEWTSNMEGIATTRLWIGNLSPDVHLDDLYRVLRLFGEFNSITLLPLPMIRTRRSAYVNFLRIQDTAMAFHYLRGKIVPSLADEECLNVVLKIPLVRSWLKITMGRWSARV